MNLQGNGNNHNNKRNLEDENDAFISFKQSSDYERITGQKPITENADGSVDLSSDEERKEKLREAIEMENSSAYEDLDDFVYKQNKKRAKSRGHHHHHHHRSPSRLSPHSSHRSSSKKKQHKHRHHFRKHHHRKRMKKWKKILIGILISIVSLLLIAVIVFAVLVNAGKKELLDKGFFNIDVPSSIDAQVSDSGNYIEYNGHKYKYNDNMTSILCMGIDREKLGTIGDNTGTGGQADTLFLLAMDLSTGKSTVVNISRDTMAEIDIYSLHNEVYLGKENAQICLAYSYGDGKESSCRHEVDAVRRLFYNLPINTYYALEMDGIGAINNSVGGVTVTSPETIGPYKAGESYSLWYESYYPKGDEWKNPVTFVQSRSHSTVEGNNMRMQRQKAYLDAFASEVYDQTKGNITTPVNIFNAASPYACSNLTPAKVSYLSVSAFQQNFKGFEIVNVPGKVVEGKEKHLDEDSGTESGYAEFYVNEKKFFKMFLDLYYIQVS